MKGRKITFRHVRGHQGHQLNEAADDHARAAATAIRDHTPVNEGPGWVGGDEETGGDEYTGRLF